MARRKRKTGLQKLRAKANKAVSKAAKNTQKAVRQKAKRAARAARRGKKTARKLAKKTTKKAVRFSRQSRKAARRLAKRTNRKAKQSVRAARRASKAAKRGIKAFKKLRRDRAKRQRAARVAANKLRREKERDFNRLFVTGEVDLSSAVFMELQDRDGSSLPGEPPKMRTGDGRKSITAELRMKGKKPEARTYVDKRIAPYMAMWEFRQDGKQRPFLKPAVHNNLKALGSEIGDSLVQQLRPQVGKKKAKVN